MGIFDKIMFWKKKDELDFDDIGSSKEGTDAPPMDDLGLDQKPAGLDEKSLFHDEETPAPASTPGALEQRPAPPPPSATAGSKDRDLELIMSKLDTIKAILTSMDQRIANLETVAGVGKKKDKLW